MMKILHVNGYPRPRMGGGELYFLSIMERLVGHPFHFYAVCLPGSDLEKELRRLSNVTVVPMKVRGFSFLLSAFKLARLVRQERISLIQTHECIPNFLGRLIKLLTFCPVKLVSTVVTIQSESADKAKGKFKHFLVRRVLWVRRQIERGTHFLSDRFVVNSEAIKQDLAVWAHVAPERVDVVYFGIDPLPYQSKDAFSLQKLRRDLNIPEHRRIVGSVASLIQVKGHAFLIEAANQILKGRRDVHFLLVGGGALEEELKVLVAQKGLTDHFTFTGYYPHAIASIIPLFDIKVLCSSSESFGFVVLEGMAAGKPVIGTNTGGIPEMIRPGENGFLIPPGDVKGLVQAMTFLLENEALAKEMGKQGMQLVEKKFSLQAKQRNLLKLYERLCLVS